MDDKTAEAMSTLRNSPDLADVEAGELLAARIAELESQLLSAQQELTVCKRTNKWLPNMTAQDGLLKNNAQLRSELAGAQERIKQLEQELG